MTITAKVVADSIGPHGIRLLTVQTRYPKFIHGELMTHRVFSRNASSSRAIPVERLIRDVMEDPAMPVFWGANRPGMQATEELDERQRNYAEAAWLAARDDAVRHARSLHQIGAHKQIVNRAIEPWCHINVVITATDWENFFALRRHPDAQPEMRALADAIHEAMQGSTPASLKPGEWHLPYVTDEDDVANWLGRRLAPVEYVQETRIRLSVARCARVSYLTHDGRKPDIDDDMKLYERLVGSTPLHASPAEHQATPDCDDKSGWARPELHGNLRGWVQYRKTLPNECVSG